MRLTGLTYPGGVCCTGCPWKRGAESALSQGASLSSCPHARGHTSGRVEGGRPAGQCALGGVTGCGQGWLTLCGPFFCLRQLWPNSSLPVACPARMGNSTPTCVSCVRGQGKTNVPAPPTNRTLATPVPSSERDSLLLPGGPSATCPQARRPFPWLGLLVGVREQVRPSHRCADRETKSKAVTTLPTVCSLQPPGSHLILLTSAPASGAVTSVVAPSVTPENPCCPGFHLLILSPP